MPTMPPLTLRLPKGSPLTPAETDENFKILRDYANSLGALFGVALNPDGTLKNPSAVYVTASGGPFAASPSDYTITLTPVPTALSELVGKLIVVNFPNPNFGAVRINPNALGNVNVKKFGNVALESDDIKANQIGIIVYDGTNFQYESWPGVVQPTNYVEATGAANAYVVTHATSGYFQEPAALYAGYTIKAKIPATNTTTTPQITVGALPAVTIVRPGGAAVAAGDLIINGIYDFVYDGTNFQLQTIPSRRVLVHRSADTIFTAANAVLITDQAHNLDGKPDSIQIMLVNKANTAGLGYAVGDELPLEHVLQEGQAIAPFSVSIHGTATFSLYCHNITTPTFYINPKNNLTPDAGVTFAELAADWNVAVRLIRVV